MPRRSVRAASPRPRKEQLVVHAVHHHRQPRLVGTPFEEPPSIAVADGHDARRRPIHRQFQLREQADDHAVANRLHRRDRLGPEVPDLQHQRASPKPCHENAGPAAEELRRCRENHVRATFQRTERDRREHVGDVVQRSPPRAGVRGQIGNHPNHADAFPVLHLPKPVAVARVEHAAWVIGRRRDHRDLVAGRRPAPAVRERPRRRCVSLGRKIMREKQDTHVSACRI